jgi:hypothetical protein
MRLEALCFIIRFSCFSMNGSYREKELPLESCGYVVIHAKRSTNCDCNKN